MQTTCSRLFLTPCSTPFGITEVLTRPRKIVGHLLLKCSTPFGITRSADPLYLRRRWHSGLSSAQRVFGESDVWDSPRETLVTEDIPFR